MMSLKQARRMDAKALRKWRRTVFAAEHSRDGRRCYQRAYRRWTDARAHVLEAEKRYVTAGKIQYLDMPF